MTALSADAVEAGLAVLRAAFTRDVAAVRAAARLLGIPPTTLDEVALEVFVMAHSRGEDLATPAVARARLVALTRRVAEWYREELPPGAGDGPLPVQGGPVLARFLAGLEPQQREVFVLGELGGLHGPEVSAELGISFDAARTTAVTLVREFAAATAAGAAEEVIHDLIEAMHLGPVPHEQQLAALLGRVRPPVEAPPPPPPPVKQETWAVPSILRGTGLLDEPPEAPAPAPPVGAPTLITGGPAGRMPPPPSAPAGRLGGRTLPPGGHSGTGPNVQVMPAPPDGQAGAGLVGVSPGTGVLAALAGPGLAPGTGAAAAVAGPGPVPETGPPGQAPFGRAPPLPVGAVGPRGPGLAGGPVGPFGPPGVGPVGRIAAPPPLGAMPSVTGPPPIGAMGIGQAGLPGPIGQVSPGMVPGGMVPAAPGLAGMGPVEPGPGAMGQAAPGPVPVVMGMAPGPGPGGQAGPFAPMGQGMPGMAPGPGPGGQAGPFAPMGQGMPGMASGPGPGGQFMPFPAPMGQGMPPMAPGPGPGGQVMPFPAPMPAPPASAPRPPPRSIVADLDVPDADLGARPTRLVHRPVALIVVGLLVLGVAGGGGFLAYRHLTIEPEPEAPVEEPAPSEPEPVPEPEPPPEEPPPLGPELPPPPPTKAEKSGKAGASKGGGKSGEGGSKTDPGKSSGGGGGSGGGGKKSEPEDPYEKRREKAGEADPGRVLVELEYLSAIDKAIKAKNWSQALAYIEQHDKELPGGQLVDKFDERRIRALCGWGRASEAKTKADQILARRPTSKVKTALAESCK